jgi:hypothetical protein
MISGEPIETGLVKSLARPGGNVTGLTFLSPDWVGKRLELLKEVVPTLRRVAILWDSEGPAKKVEFKQAQAEAPALGLGIQSLEIKAPNPDLEGAFAAAAKGRAGALLTLGNPLTLGHRKQIAELVIKNRLPSMFDSLQFVEAGGILSYGPNFSDIYRRSAAYVDRILKGAKPADLPVEQPMKFELIINLKTAKQIGLTTAPLLSGSEASARTNPVNFYSFLVFPDIKDSDFPWLSPRSSTPARAAATSRPNGLENVPTAISGTRWSRRGSSAQRTGAMSLLSGQRRSRRRSTKSQPRKKDGFSPASASSTGCWAEG